MGRYYTMFEPMPDMAFPLCAGRQCRSTSALAFVAATSPHPPLPIRRDSRRYTEKVAETSP